VVECWTQPDCSFTTVKIDGAVATVSINRPERMNSLHPAAHRELSDIFDWLARDDAIRVVIVTGCGNKSFCAGYDLKDNLETGRMELPPTGFGGLNNRVDYPHPLIAAVNGTAYGGGFELALACDIILAATSARFALPEPKVGWAAIGGGVQRLPQAIGTKRAMDMILTGRSVSAEEGMTLGFVSEVVPDEQLLEAAMRWARQIVSCAPLAIRASRQVAYGSMDQGWIGGANFENYPVVRDMLESEDAVEGKRAFIERRPAAWRGK
jgi:enoyl-CoA hydratase/carnithine racemase